MRGAASTTAPLPRVPNSHPADDVIQPFQIESAGFRGRLVRLGGSVDTVLGQHTYPAPVALLLAETIALATVLAGGLKFDGVFTAQAVGDGPVRLVLADMTSSGDLRGYAQYDADRLDAWLSDRDVHHRGASVPDLLGEGYLAFTVDQSPQGERYQGIVDLKGDSLSECAHNYLENSEQIASDIRIVAGRVPDGVVDAPWRAAALMVQHLPASRAEGAADAVRPLAADDEDEWRRARVLMDTARTAELLDPALSPDRILYRLFHEAGVRVYRPTHVRPRCRCSRERVVRTLRAMGREEIVALKLDDEVVVTCEFCNTVYRFDDTALDALYAA